MIWKEPQQVSPPPSGLVEYILAELRSLEDIRGARQYDHDLAESAAECLLQELSLSGKGDHPACVIAFDSARLLLILGRALWSIGEEQSARTLFARRAQELNVAPESMEAIFAHDAATHAWHTMLAARALRCFAFAGAINETLWILDLRQLTATQATVLELTLHNLLRAALKCAAGLWDATQGRGCLALGHTAEVARKMAGQRQCTNKQQDEIRSVCALELDLLTKQRGWTTTPRLMTLDLTI